MSDTDLSQEAVERLRDRELDLGAGDEHPPPARVALEDQAGHRVPRLRLRYNFLSNPIGPKGLRASCAAYQFADV